MKYRTTSPSHYFERQRNNPQHVAIPAPRRTREDDYGVITGFVFIAAFAFCVGMMLTATWAGVL
jgi:hypothetical protein